MTDWQTAITHLEQHALCFCRNGVWQTRDGRGIAPVLALLPEPSPLQGAAVADAIVGKAAAMLFVKAGAAAVYGSVMSQSAVEVLESHGVPYQYGTLTEMIRNRQGTGACPMEQTVAQIDDVETGCRALQDAWLQMQIKNA